jgi:hypothetical protein
MASYLDNFWKRWVLKVTGTILAAALLTIFTPLAARAQCVTNLNDYGTGSLRYCISTVSSGTITFSPSLNGGTITLSSPLGILDSITIAGPGANLLTISGGHAVEVFTIAPNITVTISGLTIAHGFNSGDGGGISNNGGTLTINSCTLSENQASAGGGGIYSLAGTATVNNSTFSGNTAVDGGGILSNNAGTLVVNSSTFSGNTASTQGGGISQNGTTTVNNSTFSGNTAVDGGGIYNAGGTVTLNNSILASNTTTSQPGIECQNCGTPSNNNLIVIGGAQLAPLGWYGGPTQTMLPLPGSPAIGNGMASTTDDPNMDQRGFKRPTTGAVDLGAVQTNYLIVTTTTDVLDNSPGCDASGGSPCSLRDALTLASSGSTDIAFAAGLAGTIALSSTLPSITGNLDLFGPGADIITVSGAGSSVVGSIFNVTSSNAAISGITIANGNSSGYGGGLYNAGGLTVNNSAFSGNTAGFGGGLYNYNATLAISNSTLSVNSAGDVGGGIASNGGTLTVTNSTFSANTASNVGGGILLNGGTLAVNNSTFSGNSATNGGGGIFTNGGTLTVNNSILTGDGGGECSGGGTGCPSNGINGTTGNVVEGTPSQPILAPLGWYGGSTQSMLPLPGSAAICVGSVSLIPGLTDQRGFARTNLSSGCIDAGAVQTNYLIVTTTTDVSDVTPACDASGTTPCSLRDALTLANTAGSADIAFASTVTGTINLSTGMNTPLPTVTGNLDLFGPGANILTISGGNSSTVGSVFPSTSFNAAISGITLANGNGGIPGAGGGIYNGRTMTVTNSTISGNSGPEGGGILSTGTLLVSNSTISGNSGPDGGGILNYYGTLIVSNSTFSGNIANSSGGAIYNNTGTTMIATNSTFSGNTATTHGGGIFKAGGTVTLNNSIVAGNTNGGVLGSDDCDSCGTQSSYNLIGGTPQLAALGSYGGPTQTMLPLPGSPAICAGSAALDPAGLLYDQRGFPRLNTTYTGYGATTPCLDLGAVQTNYSSIQFAQPGYSGVSNQDISSPADPVVSVTENGQNIGGVPVTLSFSGAAPNSVNGAGPVTTVAGTGATFTGLSVSPGGNYTLEASLAITSSVTISNTAGLTIDTPATVTSVTTTSPSGTYTTTAVIGITVTFSKAVTVTGTPQLALNSGATVNYSSGTGTETLLFTYTVASPQSSGALDTSSTTALTLNGGSINDSSSVAANLTLPTPGGTNSLSASKTIVINTTQYTLTILVSPSGGGTVQANPAYTPNVTPPLSNGVYLPGTHVTLTATAKSPYIFSGWTGTTNSNSNPLMITMNSAVTEQANFVLPTTTIGSVSQSPAVYGEPVELIAQVSNGTSTPPNGGTVTFKNGSTIVGSGPVSHGVAVYSMNGLQVPAGGNPTIAYYSGDSTDAPSQSVSYEFLVVAAATTTTVTYSPIPAVHNKNLTLTATVKPQYSGTPTGTVTFTENGGTPVTVTLVNGTATYSFYPSQAGTFTINAVYNAPIDGNFNLSSGSVKLSIE